MAQRCQIRQLLHEAATRRIARRLVHRAVIRTRDGQSLVAPEMAGRTRLVLNVLERFFGLRQNIHLFRAKVFAENLFHITR
jgi:hypothetical protein